MHKIKSICIWAIVIRIIALAFVLLLADYLPLGFLSADFINDDVRYLAGAEIYSKTAKNIIDLNALTNAYLYVDDINIAYSEEFKLWYWIVSIIMYIFHSQIAVRLLNIFMGVLCVKYIYDVCVKKYNKKIALTAASLYAFLPYPAIFSCFLYKDQFYTLIILSLFREIILYGSCLKKKNIVAILFLLFLGTTIRSGLTVFVLFLLIALYFESNKQKVSKVYLIFFTVLLLVVFSLMTYYSLEIIERKFSAYVLESKITMGGTLSYVAIKSFSDVYRYPVAFLFSMLLPVNTSGMIRSWFEVTGLLNFVVVPVAFGCLYFLLNFKMKKDLFYWCIQILYFITILTSLGIFRHQYYLQPYMMIFFASFLYHLKKRFIFKYSSVALTLLYLIFILSRFQV